MKHCLNCGHGSILLDDGGAVVCSHPERPGAPVEVIRWTVGCPQHKTKESAAHAPD